MKHTSFSLLGLATFAHAAPVYLPNSATGTGDWVPTINGATFAGGQTISSGVTTIEEVLAFQMLPSGQGGGDANGRVFGPNASTTVTYGFGTPLEDIGGLILWNYSEDFGGAAFNTRGLRLADVTVNHAGGSTVFTDVAFAQTPNTLGTNSVAQEINPLSPPSDPVQMRLQSPPAKSKFLAAFGGGSGGLFDDSGVIDFEAEAEFGRVGKNPGRGFFVEVLLRKELDGLSLGDLVAMHALIFPFSILIARRFAGCLLAVGVCGG